MGTTAKNTKTVAVVKTQQIKADEPSSVDSFIQQAIQNNAPVETLERLFALHKEVQAEKAKSGFVQAMSGFQKGCPIIEKTKKVMNKDGQTVRYQFAPLDAIVSQIKESLGNNDLSYTWTVDHTDKGITATAKVTHVMGHSETSSFSVPIDTEGFMTAPQKHASAQTFAKRYALCNVLGISTGDEDTDATDVNKEKDTVSPKSKIIFRLRRLNYETQEKDVIKDTVKNLTGHVLVAKNYEKIIECLDILIKENEENDNSQV